jgi:hypothetical protein
MFPAERLIQTERGNRDGFFKVLQHLYSRLRGCAIWLYVEHVGIRMM